MRQCHIQSAQVWSPLCISASVQKGITEMSGKRRLVAATYQAAGPMKSPLLGLTASSPKS